MELKVYLCREPLDMRKAMDGLALLVQEAMKLDPFSAPAFVFCNRAQSVPGHQSGHHARRPGGGNQWDHVGRRAYHEDWAPAAQAKAG
ncbi:MAG: IS66 family insertion sequence element accessory protein TnpB [Spiribacter salinus]|uniref:IS66 family insertion sequence element accessory protein TnpB n=1 Tax=Spiribacter salinus TaxID=1335746 RepID=A0A540VTU3_9GAMM|nr:MAG: IS66 family insertion sequence element accessory protein TnpB [Spiribacter salinus]